MMAFDVMQMINIMQNKNTMCTVLADVVEGLLGTDASFELSYSNTMQKCRLEFKEKWVIKRRAVIFKNTELYAGISDDVKQKNTTLKAKH